jgi:hypothetical protein
VDTIFRRKPKSIRRQDIGVLVDIPLPGEQLKPIIEESLRECGEEHYRKGTILTPVFSVLVVLGLAIRRDLSYPHLIDWLVSGVRWLTCCLPPKLVEDGALSHARKRLGIEVFRRIFQKIVAAQDTLPKDFHGLTSAAFDGTGATMPDTQSNRERFGLPNSGRGAGGYPQLRAVALLVLPLRMVVDIAYGPYKGKGSGERSLMRTIIDRLPYPNLLLLLDAGLYSFDMLRGCTKDNGRQLLAKLSASVKPKRIPGKRLPDGSYLAVISQKKAIEDAPRFPGKRKRYTTIEIIVRIIEYQIPGFRPARLITTLLDPEISAKELVVHYHKRWDIEIAFDEIKTHQCATLRGQAPTILRSKTPELVEQELYATVIGYNLVRERIHQAAIEANKDARQISFLDSLQCIIDAIPNMSIATGAHAQRQGQYLLCLIAECEVDRPQRPRINPRVVKIKMSKFKRKRASDKGGYRDLENELQILTQKAA